MLEYLAMLLVISLVLIAVFRLIKNRIPLSPQVIYGTVGISFALGAFFPMAISTLTPGGVLSIYSTLIILSATALGYAESRVSINISPVPVKVADLEPETLPEEPVINSPSSLLPEDIAAIEACAAVDHSSETGPVSNAAGVVNPPETGLPAPVEDMSAVHETDAILDLTTTVDKPENEDSLGSDNLPHRVEAFKVETLTISEEPVAEEFIVVEKYVAEEPIVIEEPVAEESIVIEESFAEESIVIEESVAEEPIVVEESVAEEPIVVEKLITEEKPIVEEWPSVKEKPSETASALQDEKEKPHEIEKALPEAIQKLPTALEEYPAGEDVSFNEKLTACKEFPEHSSISTTGEEHSLNEEPNSGELREKPPVAEKQLLGGQPAYEEPILKEGLPLQYNVEVKEEVAAPHCEQAASDDVVVTCQADGPFTQDLGDEEIDEEISEKMRETDPAVIKTDPVTVNDYISAGFEARARGDLAGSAEYFFKALRLNQGQQISVALAMEISAVYQELGQYLQARMILNSVMGQKDVLNDPNLRHSIEDRLIYLDTLGELLMMAKMPNAPYSKIPNLIKIKANLEAAKRLRELTKGGRVSEKQPADFGATGS